MQVIVKVPTPTNLLSGLTLWWLLRKLLVSVCLDSQDLNNAILRPHYPMRKIDDIMRQLTDGLYFTKLDTRSGYWAIKLEKESSFSTTFYLPYGRYRIKSSQDERSVL